MRNGKKRLNQLNIDIKKELFQITKKLFETAHLYINYAFALFNFNVNLLNLLEAAFACITLAAAAFLSFLSKTFNIACASSNLFSSIANSFNC